MGTSGVRDDLIKEAGSGAVRSIFSGGKSNSSTRSSGEDKDLIKKIGEQMGKTKQRSKNIFIFMIILFILVSIIGVLFAWARSENGQMAIEKFNEAIRTFTADVFGDYFSGLKNLGSGDLFNYQINSSSRERGIVLEDFKPVGTNVIPAGKDFDLIYEIDFVNINDEQSYYGNYYCSFNATLDDDKQEERFGTIIPEDIIKIRKDETVLCRISGEDTADLDGAHTIRGTLDFESEIIDATMPVYFIPGEVADELESRGDNFFDAYGLDLSQSDLRITYNGDPIGIAIGVDGQEQPVVVRSGDVKSYNTIGITLTNEWDGDLVELIGMTLKLPEEVTLDEELNGEPSFSCPFVYSEVGRGYNEYVLDESVSGELFDYYLKDKQFFGEQNDHTFRCWIKVDESIFEDSPYAVEEYSIDLYYKYKLAYKGTQVSFIGTGDSLVQ